MNAVDVVHAYMRRLPCPNVGHRPKCRTVRKTHQARDGSTRSLAHAERINFLDLSEKISLSNGLSDTGAR